MNKKNGSALIVLSVIFVLTFILLSISFHSYTEKYAIAEAEKLVQDSLLTHRAIHKYINTISRPELFRLKKEGLLYDDYFSPKTLSFTYTARGIKNFLNKERLKAGLPEIYFKLASNNPRNELNRTDEHERQLLKQMNDSEIEKYREVITDSDGNKFLYVAIPTLPITIKCLKCHGDPADAPKEMISLYPKAAGYYEKVGDIRALISIRIPLEGHMQEGRKISTIFILITFFALLFIYLLIWYFIHRINKQHQIILDKNQELEHMATHDPLTGLANRRHFEGYAIGNITQGQRRDEKVAFLYFDLDNFKAINDDVSHHAGDLVLKILAERFKVFIRKNELIARIGGDEFCMVIYGYKNNIELENTAQRLIKESTKPIMVGGMEIVIGMSIGIATYPENGKTYDEIMSAADDAMYKVKENSKNSYEFY
ncbi:MAG: diguanylate cyclase [Pseudomonadota bacterium]